MYCEQCSMTMQGYSSKEDAKAAAKQMGLSGAHQMDDGTWMPGETHEAYHDAVGGHGSMYGGEDSDEGGFDIPGF